MALIDFHLHTTYSDGVSQTEDIIKAAIDSGMKALAITDHDNTQSYKLAVEAAKGSDLEIIPGIEINTVWRTRDEAGREVNREVHVLGFFIDPEDAGLQAVVRKHRSARITQIQSMVKALNKKARLHISFSDVASYSRGEDGSLGRPHVARALVDKAGVPTISEAFDKYLSSGCPTHIRRETVSPHEAVEAIYESGGIPVIAHPNDMQGIEDLVVELLNYGLRGLEAYHKSHTPAMIEFHCSLAEKYGLIVTGGTDFHGNAHSYVNAVNRLRMPPYIYDELKREHQRRQLTKFKVS